MTVTVLLQKITPHDGALVNTILLEAKNSSYSIEKGVDSYTPLDPNLSYGIADRECARAGYEVPTAHLDPVNITSSLLQASDDFDTAIHEPVKFGKSNNVRSGHRGYTSITKWLASLNTVSLGYGNAMNHLYVGSSVLATDLLNRARGFNSVGLNLNNMYLRSSNTTDNLSIIAKPVAKTGPSIQFIDGCIRGPAELAGNTKPTEIQPGNPGHYEYNRWIRFVVPRYDITGLKDSRSGLAYESPHTGTASYEYRIYSKVSGARTDAYYSATASKHAIGYSVDKGGVMASEVEYQAGGAMSAYESYYGPLYVEYEVPHGERGMDMGVDHYPDFNKRLSSSPFLEYSVMDTPSIPIYTVNASKDAVNHRDGKDGLEIERVPLYKDLQLGTYEFTRSFVNGVSIVEFGERYFADFEFGYQVLPYTYNPGRTLASTKLSKGHNFEDTVNTHGIMAKRPPFVAIDVLEPTFTLPNRNLEYIADFCNLRTYSNFIVGDRVTKYGNKIDTEYIPYGVVTEKPDLINNRIYMIPYFSTLDMCSETKPNYDMLRNVYRVKPTYYVQIT